ncbi:MAG: DNA polymerase III subunit delta' [Gammaproteobacteria bacterium]|nr:MAG: DNA polymerase III subunit delta' [Gammaproteobacteria bacterium]
MMPHADPALPPWLDPAFFGLRERIVSGNMPHALLINGPSGIGKGRFARTLSATLLCQAGSAELRPCGHCRSCALMRANSHPDLWLLSPAEDSKVVAIDQVRDLGTDLSLTSQLGGGKVAIITPADAMNAASANALLKTLEEPPQQTYLLLISDRPGRLPATIRSRCQQLRLPAPDRDRAVAWLTDQGRPEAAEVLPLAGGAPFRALQLLDRGASDQHASWMDDWMQSVTGKRSPMTVAAHYSKADLALLFEWLVSALMVMIRLKLSPESNPGSSRLLARLQSTSKNIDLRDLYQYLDQVYRSLRLSGTTVNQQMLLEDLLITGCDLFAAVKPTH